MLASAARTCPRSCSDSFQDMGGVSSQLHPHLAFRQRSDDCHRRQSDADGQRLRAHTDDTSLQDIAVACGMEMVERIDISVTNKENLIHIKNAITENVVLRLRKPTHTRRNSGITESACAVAHRLCAGLDPIVELSRSLPGQNTLKLGIGFRDAANTNDVTEISTCIHERPDIETEVRTVSYTYILTPGW